MKPLLYVILLTVLSHVGFVGSRITVSLSAINQGATPLTVGILMALYAVFPMLLAVQGGRLVDRVGAFRPIVIAGAVVAAGILLPFASPGLPMLFVAAAVVGTAFMLQHIALNNVIGSIGQPAARAVNFSWFALGYSASGFLGPLFAGYAIDLAGHRTAFLMLALPPIAGTALLLWKRGLPPSPQHPKADAAQHRIADLLRNPRLLPVFLFSGLLATGWDTYLFVIPIYGTRIGLSASTIGIVMSSFALATFAVRLAMPLIVKRVRGWVVIASAMAVAGLAYLLFPFFPSVPLLMALSFLLGIGLGCAQPIIMSLLYEASPPGRQGEAVGLRTSLLNGSHTLIPLASGALSTFAGMGPVFWLLALFLLGGAWFARQRIE